MSRSEFVMRRMPALPALVALSLMAACGSSHAGSNAASKASASRLKIAVFANVTGPVLSGEQNVFPVLEAWAKSVNAAGGIAGHDVEFELKDTKGDAPTATTQAQRTVGDKSILAALMFDAGAEGVIAKKITDAGLLVIGGMGYLPSIWGTAPNWLPLTTSFPAVIDAGIVMAQHLGSHSTSYVVCAEFAGCAAGAPIAESATTKLGMTFDGTIKIASSGVDYTAQCLSLKAKAVDFVMLGVPSATAMRFISACKAQGYRGQWGMTDGAIEPAAMLSDDPHVTVNLALSAFPWFANSPAANEYRNVMTQQHVPAAAWGDPHSTAAYAAAELLKKTLDTASSMLPATPTRRDLVTAYAGVRNERLNGLLPQPTTFVPDEPESLVHCYWFAQFANGQFQGADLAQAVCDPPALQS